MNKRYDCIRQTHLTADTNMAIEYSLIEDLRKVGGEKTKLCTYSRTWVGKDNPDVNEIADLFEEMIGKARANIKALAEEYGFECILSVD